MSDKNNTLNREQQRIVNEEMFMALNESNFDERLTLCFKKGADINARNADGQTVLMQSVWKESTARVRFLLRYGPDLLIKDHRNRTVFDLNKDTRNASSRAEITRMLLSAMPDSSASPAVSAPVAETGSALDVPPAPVKKGRGPGGFRL